MASQLRGRGVKLKCKKLIRMGMIAARISKKGQIVIPKAIRDKFGLKAGDIIIFRVEKGRIIMEVSRERMTDILKACKPLPESVEFQREIRSEWA